MENKRVALVTGASRGIGAGVAKYLISKGYFVHGTYFKDKDLIKKSLGSDENAAAHHLDVGDEAEVKKVLADVKKISGGLQLLVNNAAVDFQIPIEEMTLDQWNETFAVRCTGTF